jgi:hypothetical protein
MKKQIIWTSLKLKTAALPNIWLRKMKRQTLNLETMSESNVFNKALVFRM